MPAKPHIPPFDSAARFEHLIAAGCKCLLTGQEAGCNRAPNSFPRSAQLSVPPLPGSPGGPTVPKVASENRAPVQRCEQLSLHRPTHPTGTCSTQYCSERTAGDAGRLGALCAGAV